MEELICIANFTRTPLVQFFSHILLLIRNFFDNTKSAVRFDVTGIVVKIKKAGDKDRLCAFDVQGAVERMQ